MRIDVVSIFPEYLAPLRLSLIGRAIADGALDLRVHDLRDWTHDRHRTVDDTPYGGGAGMVMRPEPWGEALDALLDAHGAESAGTTDSADGGAAGAAGGAATGETAGDRPVVLVPSPAGVPFTQAQAAELAQRSRLLFACGRYEGIDQRVVEEASARAEVRMVSIGDYVLNGGEVATMVMIEAIARLIPGIIGNPESLAEESYKDGLLEYPVYTKPAQWRGREVPEVLLSGNHGAIARWRRDRRLERTARVRPDLLAALEPELSTADRAALAALAETSAPEADGRLAAPGAID
ncbi:tRNA (guanosine(37)-N1)-methyltransferase TrmD [Brevibacterium sp. 5221]|uniref:tRNA (guanine-N(1)-)-methyltransferase n=1 Tax=Brevibacterium rongguiense TaxID=2695267 RepID=A0A6N9H852_9MICO|nr:tRNA (guanosine(37)-N1)-methyltransferase TrmD [Brevibacterium rongguiense]MYM20085.1 tRNA (guanosine(37)-N1)-methyltransferase TrmD [Brevibacterium rongguiense]